MPVFILVTIGSVAGLAGGVLLLFQKKPAHKLSILTIPFAVGVLLAVSFLDLLPEALEEGEPGGIMIVVLASILVAFFIEQFLVQFHHHKEEKHSLQTSLPLLVTGDVIHNFVDGVIIAAAYIANPALGITVASATFLHELPHEIGDFGVMLASGWKKTKVLATNLFSSLATYTGAASAFIFAEAVEENINIILAIAAGIFIYIATSDLLPQIGKKTSKHRLPQAGLILAGILTMWLVGTILPHD